MDCFGGFMFNWRIITAPLIGGLIGLITNGIAIQMLFRPFYPIKIGKHTLPFTPGLIPKEKPRIAKAIGRVIGDELLDPETLQKALASDQLREALNKKVDGIAENLGHEEGTVHDYLVRKGIASTSDDTVSYVSTNASEYITERILEENIGSTVLDHAMEEVLSNMNSMVAMMAEPALQKARPRIARKIDVVIAKECPGIIKGYIDGEYQKWMDKPMKEAGIILWQKKEQIKDKIWELYVQLLQKKATPFIERLDVANIVEQKINEFDVAYVEKLIMDISKKELNALVWIGGVLGVLIGFVNVL